MKGCHACDYVVLGCNFSLVNRLLLPLMKYMVIWRCPCGKELTDSQRRAKALSLTVCKELNITTTTWGWKWDPSQLEPQVRPQDKTKHWFIFVWKQQTQVSHAQIPSPQNIHCFKSLHLWSFIFATIDKYYSGFPSQIRTLLPEKHFRENQIILTEPLLLWNIIDLCQGGKKLQNGFSQSFS